MHVVHNRLHSESTLCEGSGIRLEPAKPWSRHHDHCHLIRTSKSRRQLIFVIHNSNIVVNGDADKIVVLKSDEPVMPPDPNAPKIQIDEDCGEGYAGTNHEKAGSTIAAAGDCK
jgi:hypothetical protein